MRRTIKVLAFAIIWPASVSAQTEQCITDVENARLIADFQTASLLCPKWQVINRVDYGYLLLQMKVIKSEDLLQSESKGVLTLREQCQNDLYQIETDSFESAREKGLEAFCIDTSLWLTVPNVRHALESKGFFPSGLE